MHVKESVHVLNGRNGILGSHYFFGDHKRGWDFVSPGRGGVPFEKIFRALNSVGYSGSLSVEWEDNRMDREQGAPEALALVRKLDLVPAEGLFEEAFLTDE
jgi:sugar phosphate isomerase/epimerase